MTKNKWCVENNTIYIWLKNKDGEEVGIVKVDYHHKDTVLNSNWCYSQGYAVNRKRNISMHRLLTDAPKGTVVDHINHDKLDNRDENLRICTIAENVRNRSKQTGVRFRKDRNKWQAYITHNYKYIHIGYYDTQEEAISKRNEFGGNEHE